MNKLIVGLGNPGKKYENTRHNAGFKALDYLADQWHVNSFSASRHADALTTDAIVAGEKVGVVKPQTFMNKSGVAVQALSDYFDITSNNILIVHDDIALNTGELRVSFASSSGGHNGVQSIINHLGTQEFTRLRIGVESVSQNDQKGAGISTRSYVLGAFTEKQKKAIENVLPQAETAARRWVKEGYKSAMNAVN